MLVTKIEPQKRHKNRSSVYLDGVFAFGISNFDLYKFRLQEGVELTEEALEQLRQAALCQDARQYALRLLDVRAYTEAAIRKKLTERGTDPAAISDTISFLKEYHYIDDAAYAARYIQTAARLGKSGKRKVIYDLMAKGISKEIAEAAASEVPFEEEESIAPILEKRLKGDYSFHNKMKAKRYLLSRGFAAEAVDRALWQLTDSEEEWFDA